MRNKIIFGIAFVVYGIYLLGFHQYIEPNTARGGLSFLSLIILLAAIPLISITIPFNKSYHKDFLKKGIYIVSLTWIILTTFVFILTTIFKNYIYGITDFNEQSRELYNLTRLNYLVIINISLVICVLTCVYNIKSIKDMPKVKVVVLSTLPLLIQIVYSWLVIFFIYIKIT